MTLRTQPNDSSHIDEEVVRTMEQGYITLV